MKNPRKIALGTLILATVCFGLLAIPASFAMMMSPMAFDTGISTAAIILFVTLLTYPLMVLVSVPASWIAYRRGGYRTAITLSLLPAINLVALALIFGFGG